MATQTFNDLSTSEPSAVLLSIARVLAIFSRSKPAATSNWADGAFCM